MKRTSILALLGILTTLSFWFFLYYQSQIYAGTFGIYLVRNNTEIVSNADIQSYNVTSHELVLTSECAERLETTKGYLEGDFAIVVGGSKELHGLFVPPMVSRSYPSNQVVIVFPSFESSFKTMKIQMGYPWDQPSGQDRRENPRIAQFFERTGRLVR